MYCRLKYKTQNYITFRKNNWRKSLDLGVGEEVSDLTPNSEPTKGKINR